MQFLYNFDLFFENEWKTYVFILSKYENKKKWNYKKKIHTIVTIRLYDRISKLLYCISFFVPDFQLYSNFEIKCLNTEQCPNCSRIRICFFLNSDISRKILYIIRATFTFHTAYYKIEKKLYLPRDVLEVWRMEFVAPKAIYPQTNKGQKKKSEKR